MRYIESILAVLLVPLLLSCEGSPSSVQGGNLFPSDYPDRGLIHWASFLEWDQSKIEEAAESKIAIFPIQHCLSSRGDEIINRIKSINPDIKIIGYQALLGVNRLNSDTNNVQRNTSYSIDYYHLARDHWVWTTTGDTLLCWPDIISLNPLAGDTLDMEFLFELVDLLETYRDGRESSMDGIIHDYFMNYFYITPYTEGQVEGQIDLDGNGITMKEDQRELELFLRWQIEFAREIRQRFGDDFIQIGNGRVPQDNPELAGLLNGIFYENFPNMPWGLTDFEGVQKLLENQREGYLSESCGRTWSILTSVNVEYNNHFCLVSSLLAECLYTELYGTYLFTGWEFDIHPGRPAGELMVEGSTDSIITYTREYTRYTASISFADYGGRIEAELTETSDQ